MGQKNGLLLDYAANTTYSVLGRFPFQNPAVCWVGSGSDLNLKFCMRCAAGVLPSRLPSKEEEAMAMAMPLLGAKAHAWAVAAAAGHSPSLP